MQAVKLGGLKRGIDRTRIRGAQVDGSLYDLTNAYLTISGGVQKRPPFKRVAQLSADTRGLFANNGRLHTFYTGAEIASPAPDLIACDLLPPPTDELTAITYVAFDALYLGRQFVIAKWSDGRYWSYWLPSTNSGGSAASWQANHAYGVSDAVTPTAPNGFYYTIANNQFPQAWQPSKTYAVGDVVVPTAVNGWKYTLIEAVGTNPSSGTTEPAWPTKDGETVTEEHDDSGAPVSPAPTPSNPGDRYGNPGGSQIPARPAGSVTP